MSQEWPVPTLTGLFQTTVSVVNNFSQYKYVPQASQAMK